MYGLDTRKSSVFFKKQPGSMTLPGRYESLYIQKEKWSALLFRIDLFSRGIFRFLRKPG